MKEGKASLEDAANMAASRGGVRCFVCNKRLNGKRAYLKVKNEYRPCCKACQGLGGP